MKNKDRIESTTSKLVWENITEFELAQDRFQFVESEMMLPRSIGGDCRG
jgi:hypothetical protein